MTQDPAAADGGRPAGTGGIPGASNALGAEPSAYLRQHAGNPVHWRPFGDEAFAFAAARDVPVFLSIGYAACHWCHVMAGESFEDQDTADYLNAHFVPVKVDREERPDVDAVYMAATQAISGEGGWPMSVFLLPDGRAFHAGTYYPPRPMPGRPSFRQVLEAVEEAWRERRGAVEQNAATLARGLAAAQAASAVRLDAPAPELRPELLADAVRALARAEDSDGGFGAAPKFPPSSVLEFLLRHAAVPSDTAALARDLAGRTLAAMARSALYDRVEGGFARYSVTRDWSVPHFEKMLYDNAQLLRCYLHWVRLGGTAGFPAAEAAEAAGSTADWMLGALGLTGPGGPDALASSLDADTVVDGEHVEGGSYVWTPAELAELLGPEDGERTAALMGVHGHGGGPDAGAPLHPGRALDAAEAALWQRVRPALRRARAEWPQPARDEKVVAGWNGLAVAALADAGALLERPALLAAAERIAGYLERVHWTPGGPAGAGRLVRVSHHGTGRGIEGLLEDYAFCAEGLLALYAVTGRIRWYTFAGDLLAAARVRFASTGALRDAVGESAQLANAQGGAAGAEPFDDATPSGAAAFAGALLSHAALSGAAEDRALAGTILSLLPPLAARAPRAAGWLLATAQAALAGPLEATVVGPDTPQRAALHRALLNSPSPGLVIALAAEEAAPGQEVPLLRGRTAGPDGTPRVYLCRNMVCALPVGSVAALGEQLASMAE
ncbi:thioredoxin domain-containing protein [Arthrobacter sp. Hor0625]|uniref:thioredoxin domain-containing protein n=1 Tax=Arthrobacter sp. Hor0625 TaxID=3457358 RepID=UPI00403EBA14